jgi:hypothetical protein
MQSDLAIIAALNEENVPRLLQALGRDAGHGLRAGTTSFNQRLNQ